MPDFVKKLPFWLFLGKVDQNTKGLSEDDHVHEEIHEGSGQGASPVSCGAKKSQQSCAKRTQQGDVKKVKKCDAKITQQDGAKVAKQDDVKMAQKGGG